MLPFNVQVLSFNLNLYYLLEVPGLTVNLYGDVYTFCTPGYIRKVGNAYFILERSIFSAEHLLAMQKVEGSSLLTRSIKPHFFAKIRDF